MKMLLHSLEEMILDRSAEELIGALLIAFVLAGAGSGIYCLSRRRVSDQFTLMVGLMCAANVIAMAMAASFMAKTLSTEEFHRPGPIHFSFDHALGGDIGIDKNQMMLMTQAKLIIASADKNGDSRLSTDEAAQVAVQLVRDVDQDHVGSIDAQTLSKTVTQRTNPMTWFLTAWFLSNKASTPLGPESFVAFRIVELADSDHDGRVSPDELAQLVRATDMQGAGGIDAVSLSEALRKHSSKAQQPHVPSPPVKQPPVIH